MTRDQQRSKIYSAENAIRGDRIGDGSIRDVEAFVEKVLSSAVVRRNYPNAPKRINVKDGRGRRTAAAFGTGAIKIPAGWARTTAVVLHELAHILNTSESSRERALRMHEADKTAKARGLDYWHPAFKEERKQLEKMDARASHGWQFASIFLDLVRWFMGESEFQKLRAAFKAKRVKYSRPREMSEETRAKMREIAARNFGKIAAKAAIADPELDPLGEMLEAWIERTGGSK